MTILKYTIFAIFSLLTFTSLQNFLTFFFKNSKDIIEEFRKNKFNLMFFNLFLLSFSFPVFIFLLYIIYYS